MLIGWSQWWRRVAMKRLYSNPGCKRACSTSHEGKLQSGEQQQPLMPDQVPSPQLLHSLNEGERKRLQELVCEVELIAQVHRLFPKKITDRMWGQLMRCDSPNARLQYLMYLRTTEKKREKDERKKEEKLEKRRLVRAGQGEIDENETMRDKSQLSPCLVTLPPSKLGRMERIQAQNRHYQMCLLDSPPSIAVDCRFLPKLSDRGLNLTLLQLRYLLAANRDHRHPWPIWLVNFDKEKGEDQRVANECKRHHVTAGAGLICGPEVTSANYTDVFPHDRIVYLSPDAQEDLDAVEDDQIFVIGGIVDQTPERDIHPHASLMAAIEDDVLVRRFPIERYVNWVSGKKYLTLLAVVSILQDVYASNGDWEFALKKHLPVRNVKPIEERNATVRQMRKLYRQQNAMMLEAISEKMRMDKQHPDEQGQRLETNTV